MEVVDELMTPGCPQCAIKHLSAALYHRAKMAGDGEAGMCPCTYMTHVCTAYINLIEVRAGYLSHLWYAVGALVRAEEHMAARFCVARDARLVLEEGGVDSLFDALKILNDGTVPSHADWAAAHFGEARRELPAYADQMSMDDLIGSIERIRKDFFVSEEAPAASTEGAERGGDANMAKTAKKAAPAFLKKGDPKAAKAACKGGKSKKCCK